MSFDADLAVAELKQCVVKIEHHLRRIRIERDYETAKVFNQILSTVRETAKDTQSIVRIHNKRPATLQEWWDGLKQSNGYRQCDLCRQRWSGGLIDDKIFNRELPATHYYWHGEIR